MGMPAFLLNKNLGVTILEGSVAMVQRKEIGKSGFGANFPRTAFTWTVPVLSWFT